MELNDLIQYLGISRPITFVYEQIFNLHNALINYLQYLNQTSPDVIKGLHFLRDITVIYINLFEIFLLLRMCLFWFPNINPYVHPYYSILLITDRPLRFLKKKLPVIFGIDPSFILLSMGLSSLAKYLAELSF